MNNLLNTLLGLMNQNTQNNTSQHNCPNSTTPHNNQPSIYPDTIYTNTYINSQKLKQSNTHNVCPNCQNYNQNNMINGLLNNQTIKNILPVLMGKNNGNLTNILSNNADFSKIMSIFSKNSKKTNKNEEICKNEQSSIDISNYTVVE